MTMPQTRLALLCLAALAVTTACGDDDRPTPMRDAGTMADGSPGDSGMVIPDAGGPLDAGSDAGPSPDAGPETDAGPVADSGPVTDSGPTTDSGPVTDAGPTDAGPVTDSGPTDGGPVGDAGPTCPDLDLAMMLATPVTMGTTVGATDDVTPSCSSGTAGDATFTWTAPHDGTYVFDTVGSAFDTVLSLRMTDCVGAELECDDDGATGTRSAIRIALTSGTTVLITIDGWSGATGDYVLNITEPAATETVCTDMIDEDRDFDTDCDDADCAADAACIETNCTDTMDNDGDGDTDCDDTDCAMDPACFEFNCTDGMDNDMDGDTDCADADCLSNPACDTCPDVTLAMMTGMSVATGDSSTSALNNRRGSCGGGGPDVAFQFTAPATGEYTFDTEGSAFDTVLYVLGGSCSGRELDCDDDGGTGTTSSLTVPLADGETVIIVVDGFFSTSSGTYVLNIGSTAMTYSAPTTVGELVITEIMQNPSVLTDATGEWLELYNPGSTTFNLNDCRLFDLGSNSHPIMGDLLIRPGEYLPLAISMMPGFTPGYVYGGAYQLGNADDEVIIACGSPEVEIDRVVYDGGTLWPDPTGRSMNLDPGSLTATDNDVPANWCEAPDAAGAYSGTDVGSPGAPNVGCP